ncbi:DUF1217 domain-containing protein [Methylocystis iwaonis]|uniref:DUF1217 domain-containing protein n=1 Tax=Methylocystis iwaonis TaxID=2885079 RepID=A0ABN6VLF1_9HYPH|nr:DUF1217 domain-containing protein [Methylocystis iwaonis]BDV35740.1 hypothetical protein SS37A_32690 [Methylocystis iwaonis]
MSTISSYQQISKNLSKWQAIEAKKPEVSTANKYFQENIGKVKNADDLIKNPRLFNYAMSAFGLGDRTYAKGLMKQVLQQGVTSSKALANKLNDPNIQAFAKAFDFAAKGADTTKSSTLVSSVVNRYTENALETDQGQQNPGVQLALYFKQHAPSITSAYGILADKNILTVVQTALGISPLTKAQPVDTQYRLLNQKLNIKDFQDPKKLEAFISRFAAMYDSNSVDPTSASYTGAGAANAILLGASVAGTDGVIGVDQSLLLQIAGKRTSAYFA